MQWEFAECRMPISDFQFRNRIYRIWICRLNCDEHLKSVGSRQDYRINRIMANGGQMRILPSIFLPVSGIVRVQSRMEGDRVVLGAHHPSTELAEKWRAEKWER